LSPHHGHLPISFLGNLSPLQVILLDWSLLKARK
jgi:hypothetical protein